MSPLSPSRTVASSVFLIDECVLNTLIWLLKSCDSFVQYIWHSPGKRWFVRVAAFLCAFIQLEPYIAPPSSPTLSSHWSSKRRIPWQKSSIVSSALLLLTREINAREIRFVYKYLSVTIVIKRFETPIHSVGWPIPGKSLSAEHSVLSVFSSKY